MENLHALTDAELLANLDRFALEERARMPFFLACLGEADRRKLPIEKGYSSTFDYCVRRLMLSEGEAFRRIQAARAAVGRPELLSSLAEGRLTLSAVSKIAPHIRRADAPEIIARAEGRSTREIEELLAPLRPEPAKPDRIRTVSVGTPGEIGQDPLVILSRVDFHFQGSPALRDAIERAKELLSNKYPFGDLNDVLSEIVQEYLDRRDPQRALELLKRTSSVKGRASIPARLRRAVWARDGGRCTFVGPNGVRCGTRRMLEIDHRTPRALGGPNTPENLRLLCRPHNDAERRRVLGEGWLSTNLARDRFLDISSAKSRERSCGDRAG